MDNLVAAGKAKSMIIVMDNGNARTPGEGRMGFSTFENVVINELIPMIDATYRTLADCEHRAMAGLSMGAGQSLNFDFGHLEAFAWVGAFSAAPNTKPAKQLAGDPAVAGQRLKLLWLSCGNKDGLIRISRSLHTYLKKNNVPHSPNSRDAQPRIFEMEDTGDTLRIVREFTGK